MTLRARLLIPIVLAGLFCAALAGALAFRSAALDANARAAAAAEAVGRRLDLQLTRVAAGMLPAALFPDWASATEAVDLSGLCVRFEDAAGRSRQSACGGSAAVAAPPEWAASAVAALGGADPAARPILYRGETRGRVVAGSDAGAAAVGAWERMRLAAASAAGTAALLAALATLALQPALRPLDRLVGAVARLSRGERRLALAPAGVREVDVLAEALNRLAVDLAGAEAARAALSARLIDVEDSERRALARDLHDVFGQSLTAIRAFAGTIRADAPGRPAEDAARIEELAAAMDGSLRDALRRLRAAEIDEVGLISALHRLAGAATDLTDGRMACVVTADEAVEPLPRAVAASLYRAAQEALTNAAKHAGAARVEVSLMRLRDPDAVVLVVEDDGRGGAALSRDMTDGFGLIGMRERAEALGGAFVVGAGAAGGVRIEMRAPVPAPAHPRPKAAP